ncbi:MAG: type IV pilin protein [Thiohalomonadales bacterium]
MLQKFYRRTHFGFTLVELLVVVSIVGIISVFAVPAYLQQIRKANRAEAKAALMNGSQLMERCFTEFTAYTHANCPTTADLDSMGNNFFTYTIAATTSTFTLTADANAAKNQDKDTDCVQFSISNTGLRTAKNSLNTNTTGKCW